VIIPASNMLPADDDGAEVELADATALPVLRLPPCAPKVGTPLVGTSAAAEE